MCVLACAATASAQVVNPANAQPEPQPQDQQSGDKGDGHMGTWEMPPVTVYGSAPLKEEDRIGDYAQPRWTAARRFGETRVYVVPKGMAEFEYWLIPETGRDGNTNMENMYEVEFGLPGRFQVDLYAVGDKTGPSGPMALDQQKAEVRWAFADWNRIFGNPTLYAEWTQVSNAADHVEFKMLFGGELASRWHWGSNLVWEHTAGDTFENSNEWTTGLSYTLKDMGVSVGMETQLALVNERIGPGLGRTPFSKEFLIGPSIQFRPLQRVHIDIAPLFGATTDASRAKTFVVMGWEF